MLYSWDTSHFSYNIPSSESVGVELRNQSLIVRLKKWLSCNEIVLIVLIIYGTMLYHLSRLYLFVYYQSVRTVYCCRQMLCPSLPPRSTVICWCTKICQAAKYLWGEIVWYFKTIYVRIVTKKDHLGYPGVNGRIILRWTFRKWDGGYGLDWSGSG